ncbi:MAG: VPLPA-CTERM sorting domain-containing protein [Pseudomonadota bacterium]
MKHSVLLSVLVLMGLSALPAAAATLVASDTPPDFLTTEPRVSSQFRNGQAGLAGAGEIYVAPSANAGNTPTRAEGQFAWSNNTLYTFTFSYDSDGGFGGQGLLTSTLRETAQAPGAAQSAVFGDTAGEVVSSDLTFNAMRFNVQGNSNGDETLSVNEMFINGMQIDTAPFGTPGAFADFGVTGFGTVSDFDIVGQLTRPGSSLGTSQAAPRLDFVLGTVEDLSEIPLPASAWMLLAALAGLGAGLRRRRAA